MKLKKIALALAVSGLMVPGLASATNGYFSHGYGIKSKAMGGVGIALSDDAMAAASNPAGMAVVGDRIDFGVDWFNPNRTATWGSPGFRPAGDYDSGNNNFLVPEFGYNRMINDRMSLGVAVFGNGGMNTDYGKVVLGNGTTNTYSNLEQLFISPTWAMKVTPDQSIGVSLNLIYQTFEARGLQGFQASSQSPNNVTDQGKDTSTGASLRLGWQGKVSPSVTLGATYQSRAHMSKFDKYKGLFAEQGSFDIPETYGVGIAVKANPKLTVAADLVEIKYGSIKSLANDGSLYPGVGFPFPSSGVQMGADNGAGFGWSDQTVFKLGFAYEYSPNLTLRAGWNHGKMPLKNDQTYFNILAPATVEDHLTLGATWTLANKSELSVSYMHAFSKGINGTGGDGGTHILGSGAAGWPVNLKMDQNALGIAYGWKM